MNTILIILTAVAKRYTGTVGICFDLENVPPQCFSQSFIFTCSVNIHTYYHKVSCSLHKAGMC